MRLEDLLFIEGWSWQKDLRPLTLKPGESELLLRMDKNKGFFFGAVAGFTGSGDAKYASLTVNIDDTLYMPLYPYGLALLGLDMWTPYGIVLLKYDNVGKNYVVAETPNYLIPIRRKLEIRVDYPRTVTTWFGQHTNTDTITVYVAYVYIIITDEKRFKKTYREFVSGIT